ncbi:MAG: T9SS type A sorting domain-containing protein [Ferruginibacter sp.]
MEIRTFQIVVVLLFFFQYLSVAQEKFDYYLSAHGNDSNPGTSKLLAKKTINGIAPILKNFFIENGSVKVGLRSGDIWEENLVTSYPIQLNTYSDNSNKGEFAIMNGSKEFSTGWVRETGIGNTYKQAIPYTGFTGYGINGIGSYSYIYILEIDKELEKTAPFTARKLLKFQPALTIVENTAGSFYSPVNTNENPKQVYIHTSDGSSPNANLKYRYEVTVRDWAVNGTYQQDNRFENLWVRGFGAGNGMLPGGANSYYNKIIFGPGAAIHHLVLRSGTINNSLFLPGPKNTNAFAVVFYDVEGLGRHCTIKNSMFLDIGSPVYAHTSLGTNYGAVEMDNVLGFADSTETSGFIYTFNNDSVILNKVYTDGYTTGYNYGNAKYAAISNSWFKDVTFGIAYSAKNPVLSSVDNVFIKTRGTTYTSGIIMQGNTSLTFTNSIIHIVNTSKNTNGARAGSFVSGAGATTNKIVASGNIFICDIAPSKYLTAAVTNTNNGKATSKDRWNNNVYILLRGNNILWTATNSLTNGGSTNIQNFDEWKRQSGQDQQSLFFDLRYDRRGLKAIFTDPENGNYDLANTAEGNQIAALRAGMISPITCFLQKPTYEEAASLIRNNKVLGVNTCRNPCSQNKIRVNATFGIAEINKRQIRLHWNISEQENIDHYEIQRSTGNLIFTRISSIPVSTDSLYSFIDDIQSGITYRYRLMIAPKAGGKCYSDTRTLIINDNKTFTIYPNPSRGKIWISMNGYLGRTNFVISNSVGQTILAKEFLSLYRAQELDLSNQPGGVYLLKVITGNGIAVQKFSLE